MNESKLSFYEDNVFYDNIHENTEVIFMITFKVHALLAFIKFILLDGIRIIW